jgi:membrane protein
MNQLKPVKLILKEFSNDRVSQLSAAFSYSALFSLAPLLLVLISVAGIIYGNQAASGKLFSEMSGSVGPATAKSIQTLVSHIHNSKSGALAILVGTIGSLLGAAGLTSLLQNSFNIILRVVPDPKSGIKRTIYVKLKNISLVILAGLFVAISLVLSALITGFSHKLSHHLGLPSIILELTNDIV